MDTLKTIITSDGSTTLFNSVINDTYHSRHGAITEAKHVYIKEGLIYISRRVESELSILEVGLGTGMNCLLSLKTHRDELSHLNIQYTAIEPYPPSEKILHQLNYAAQEQLAHLKEEFHLIHNCPFEKLIEFYEHFKLLKIKTTLQEFKPSQKFNLVYYDAFGPKAQPELWEHTALKKVYDTMSREGVFITFCAKGEVKRTLKKIGFLVETIPGPPGKREITRAIKS